MMTFVYYSTAFSLFYGRKEQADSSLPVFTRKFAATADAQLSNSFGCLQRRKPLIKNNARTSIARKQ
jgi:hypothetical protein